MPKSIAWGITGAGALLAESIETVKTLLSRGHRVTVFVSRAGETLLRLYGLKNQLEEVVKGPYPTGIIYESQEPPGYPSTGRVYNGVYDFVVVSPATMNTVSKIINGIADTLVTNLVMHAVKAGRQVLILPVDAYETRSKIPMLIRREKCNLCTVCYAARACPYGALVEDPWHKVRVFMDKCTRCYNCLSACPHGAIVFDAEITVKPVPYYLDLIMRLTFIPGVRIIRKPEEVLEYTGELRVETRTGHW